jgi:hypothetical protein
LLCRRPAVPLLQILCDNPTEEKLSDRSYTPLEVRTLAESQIIVQFLDEASQNGQCLHFSSASAPIDAYLRASARLFQSIFENELANMLPLILGSQNETMLLAATEKLAKGISLLNLLNLLDAVSGLDAVEGFLTNHFASEGLHSGPFICGANFSFVESICAPDLQRLIYLAPFFRPQLLTPGSKCRACLWPISRSAREQKDNGHSQYGLKKFDDLNLFSLLCFIYCGYNSLSLSIYTKS